MPLALQDDLLHRLAAVMAAIDAQPDAPAVAQLLRRTLLNAPGVADAQICLSDQPQPPDPPASPPAPAVLSIPLATAQSHHGFIALTLSNEDAFAPCQAFAQCLASFAAASLHACALRKNHCDLRASERKYREIFHNVSDALLLFDVTDAGRFHLSDVNPTAAHFPGLTARDWGDRYLDEIGDAEIAARLLPKLRRCLETGETISCEEQAVLPSGPRFLRCVYIPLRNQQGAIHRILNVGADITDLKQTEATLRLKEERYHSLVTATSQLVWVADSQGNTIQDSPSWLSFTGQTAEEGRDRRWLAAVHPDDRQRIAAHWSHAVETGELFETEYRVRRFDGEYRAFANRGVAILDQNGSIREWVGACFDITERKRAEEAIRLSEERYRTLVTASSQMVWTMDALGQVEEDAPSLRAFTGLTFAEIEGDGWRMAIHPDDRTRADAIWSRAMESGALAEAEHRLLRHDGEYRWVSAHAAAIVDANNKVHGWIGAATDVTERVQAEASIRLQADQYATILSATSDGFWLITPEGELIDVNDAACKMTGYSRDELLKLRVWDLEAAETREEFLRHIREIVTEGFAHFESRHMKKDGSQFDAEVSVAYWRATGRNIVFIRDVTERKRAEAVLRDTDAKLREAQEMAEVGSWDWDLSQNILHWSAEECRLLGRDVTNPPPTFADFLSFVHPDDRKRLKDGIDEVRHNGAPFQLEYRIIQSSGEVRVVDARMKGFPGPDGQPIRISGTVHDITKAKKSEENIKAASRYARNLIEASLDPLMTINPEGKITDINEAAVRALDAPREAIVGTIFADHFTEPERAAAAFRSALSTGYVTNNPLTIRQSSGALIHVLLNASIYRSPRGEPDGVLATARDVTEQNRRSEELVRLHEQMTATVAELRQREQDTSAIDELSETLQTCRSREEAYPLIGIAASQLFPWSNGGLAVFVPDGLDLCTVAEWGDARVMLPDFTMEACWALRRGQLHQLDAPGAGAMCSHFRAQPSGSSLCLPLAIPGEALGMLHLNSVSPRPIDERTKRLLVTLGDVVKLCLSNLKLRETLRRQAIRDPLTGLFNRHYLNETLPRELQRAQRMGLPLCVAMLDVDHFKKFNDDHGHDAGDLVLREVGDQLHKAVRESDMACRYGGEEFLFVLFECDMAEARERIRDICSEIGAKPCVFHGRTLPAVTLSVGLAELGDARQTQAELIATADRALYMAKNSGRNKICP
jgi:diguanylate cyclase (GGDEF)-like protein/PAS domain S-box-containing protein